MLVAPAVPYGSSGEHAGFPGTLSIGQDALDPLLVELVRSADAFAGVLIVSGHGGNAEPLPRPPPPLTEEGRRVRSWSPRPFHDDDRPLRHPRRLGRDLAPARPLPRRRCGQAGAAAGVTHPLAELAIAALRAGGVAAVSANGVLGDPTTAGRAGPGWALGRRSAASVVGWP